MPKTVCSGWCRRFLILPIIWLLSLLGTAAAIAQTYEGETPVELGRGIADENGDILRLQSMTIRWRFTGLMGEPLRQFAGRYQHYDPPWVELANVQTCYFGNMQMTAITPAKVMPDRVPEGVLESAQVYSHTRFRMIIEPHSGLGFARGPSNTIQHEFTVDTFSQTEEYGLSIAGSPSWDRLFQIGPVGPSGNPWLSEAEAKELFRVGFSVRRIDMIEPRYALARVRASYERHFNGCGEDREPVAEEGDGGEEALPSNGDDRSDAVQSLDARLGSMLERVAATQSAAISVDPAPSETNADRDVDREQTDPFEIRRSEAANTHESAMEACHASRPAGPHLIVPTLTLWTVRPCEYDSSCPPPRPSSAPRGPTIEEQNAQKRREHEQRVADWEASELPRCLAQADAELSATLQTVERDERNVNTLNLLSNDLRGQFTNFDN